ncbi:MAG: helix-turn-helix transcriptional regulator [Acutalibacteraceae bacterium]
MFKIKEFRQENDYTQRYLAYKIGVSQQAIVKWESGQSVPNITHLIMLSALIGCSIDELINSRQQ